MDIVDRAVSYVIGLMVMIVVAGVVSLFVLMWLNDDGVAPEAGYDADMVESVRELERRLSAAEDETQVLRQIVINSGQDRRYTSYYVDVAARYYGVLFAMFKGTITEDPLEVIAELVVDDEQLAAVWSFVWSGQVSGRIFENLLWAKVMATLVEEPVPALDG